MTDPVPEWLRDAADGEMRIRMQCNLCGAIEEGRAILAPEVRNDMFAFIRDHPDDALDAVRTALHFAAGWKQIPLPDGGAVDICPSCLDHSPWLHAEMQL
jgi:hypothetical protein